MTMDSVEKLIDLVQAHPCLYNSSHKHYRNSAQKELVWQKISQELQKSCDETKNKWKNLKDGYTKYRKHRRGAGGQKKAYAKWVWGPYLKFLEPHRQGKPPSDGNASPTSGGFDMDEEVSLSPMACEVMLPSPPQPAPKPWTADEQDSIHQILEHIKSEKRTDATDHLFASYAETFKKLKPRTQHRIKLHLAQMFADAELEDLNAENLELVPVGCAKTES